jgi:serine/threonine protein kinase
MADDEMRKNRLDLVEQVEALHAAGLEHRSLRPGNTTLGGDGFARVIDFGRCAPHTCSGRGRCDELDRLCRDLDLKQE